MRSAGYYRRRASKRLLGNYRNLVIAEILKWVITAITMLVSILFALVLRLTVVFGSLGVLAKECPPVVLVAAYVMFFIIFCVLAMGTQLLEAGLIYMVYRVFCQKRAWISGLFYGLWRGVFWKALKISLITAVVEVSITLPSQIIRFLSYLVSFASLIVVIFLFVAYVTFLLTMIVRFLYWLLFGLAMYVLIDQPQLGALGCMRESARLLRGRRLRYIWFELSFLGWYFLALLTFGVGLLWIEPYHRCAVFAFYEDLKLEKQEKAAHKNKKFFI